MEAGLNARAIDFAKLGRLYLNRGEWDGNRILSPEWVDLATGVDPGGRAPAFDARRFYGLMWWGYSRESGPADFAAMGDHGQNIFVSPQNHVVIVRTGAEYGIQPTGWIEAFSRAADALGGS
jgi:CubicO group peptidase (beta-lactamase class C family)